MSKTQQPSHVIDGSFKVSAPPLNRLSCGREQEPLPLPTHQNGWATPNRFGTRVFDGRIAAVDPAGTAASGPLLTYAVQQYQQSLGDGCAHCRVLRTLPALDTRSHDDPWTKCRHPETAHNTVRPMIVPFDHLELFIKA